MQRREFLKISLVASSALFSTQSSGFATSQPRDNQKISSVRFPEKTNLIVHSDRPPLLESPRATFTRAITPNDAFFVRWHMPVIPTHINMTQTAIS